MGVINKNKKRLRLQQPQGIVFDISWKIRENCTPEWQLQATTRQWQCMRYKLHRLIGEDDHRHTSMFSLYVINVFTGPAGFG